jgi:chromosome segregation ATPase
MADMAQSLRTEMKAMLQNEMQDSLAPFMQWRDHIDTQLTAYDITLADFTTSHDAVQQEVRALADRLESMAPSKHYPGKLATARLQRHALTLCNEEPSKHYPGKLATARLQRHALTLRANSRVKKKRYTTSHTAVQKDVRALAARLGSLAPNVQDVMTQLETTGDTATDIRVEPTEHERRLKERDSLAPNVQAVMKQSEAAHWDVEQKHKALERAHAERCARLQAEVQKVRDLEQQQEEADGRGLLQFEAEQLRNKEELLSSKELAFANPPRISPAPWTHSSRTRDFAYEQEKMQGNDRRPPPGNTYWLSLYFDYEQEKMRGNDRRPTPGSTYWLSLYVVVAARRSSSTS